MQPEVVGHDDFTRDVSYAPLPKKGLGGWKSLFLCGARGKAFCIGSYTLQKDVLFPLVFMAL